MSYFVVDWTMIWFCALPVESSLRHDIKQKNVKIASDALLAESRKLFILF